MIVHWFNDVEQVRLPGDEVAVYPVMVAPPSEPGVSHVTVACVFPPVADTFVGGVGGPAGNTAEVDWIGSLTTPSSYVAVIEKV